ncbi:hypothetical protein T03_10097 [Trichinella britovi]|uniref:Uncharacterized protein n=1 Tax=Trichinella britovi TaxID=45882 RepID=A0A0V1C547_TRIBR|nr:hypothetical protein T03_10097 [Trichinella britovi]
MVEFWYRNVFRHYNGVFVGTVMFCATFRCFEQVVFPSFTVLFLRIAKFHSILEFQLCLSNT